MKEKTPFEKAGYNPTDVFVTEYGHVYVVHKDDGTSMPWFRNVHSGEIRPLMIHEVERIHGEAPTKQKFLRGALFKDDWGDVYMLCRLNAHELQFFCTSSGNRWSDEPFSEPVTSDDLPERFEYLPNHVLEVGEK